MSGRVPSHWTRAAAVAVALAVVHSWPLATAPATLSLNYNGDVMLNEWIVAWVQHQLLRAPLELFQANIFYPAPDALAFSEPLIVPALLGYPVRLLGGSPVLVHNLLLLAGLSLTMLGAYALAHHWTGDPLASLVAGAAYTFNTQSLVRLEHLQAAHAYGLPLALLAADRLITTGDRRQAWWLGGWMIAMAYSSGYLVIFTTVALAVLALARTREWMKRPAQVIGGLTLAAVVTGAAVLPLYLPYRRVANEQGMRRTLEGVAEFSAAIDGYLASYSRLHHRLWNAGAPRQFPDAYFPGIVVAVLAMAGIASGGRRRTAVPALVALCVVGCVLSLGTRTPFYGWLYAVFPPMSALRGAARFGTLFLLGMALLAGIGLAALRAHVSRRVGAIVAMTALVVVNLEALRAPFNYTPFRGIPGLYALLAKEPDPVVLVEVPFYPAEAAFQNAEYVLNSTAHWRPLMNGYSGYTPATYRDHAPVFWSFPDPGVVEAMRAAGATHLMLHPRRFEGEALETLRKALAHPNLERMAVSRDNLTLFRIR
ncbi:MAG TPA: hypothetical protein VJ813_16270 [Vicinamibacterales bacterium]|nr:hypothetical protein [Vicinamibacterales bacterium]